MLPANRQTICDRSIAVADAVADAAAKASAPIQKMTSSFALVCVMLECCVCVCALCWRTERPTVDNRNRSPSVRSPPVAGRRDDSQHALSPSVRRARSSPTVRGSSLSRIHACGGIRAESIVSRSANRSASMPRT